MTNKRINVTRRPKAKKPSAVQLYWLIVRSKNILDSLGYGQLDYWLNNLDGSDEYTGITVEKNKVETFYTFEQIIGGAVCSK